VKYFSKDTLKKKSISLVSHLQHAHFFTKSGMEIWLENCSWYKTFSLYKFCI